MACFIYSRCCLLASVPLTSLSLEQFKMDQVDDLPALLHAVAYPTADYAVYAQNEATLQSSLKIPGTFMMKLL